MLDFIKKVFKFIDGINPTIKTIIIMALLFWCTQVCLVNQSRIFITDYVESVEYNNRKSEEYSLRTSPKIKRQIENIKNKDADASNVLLLSFHNTKKSLQGFSYMYLTALTDSPRGIDDESCVDIWTNLPYLQFTDEVEKIRRAGYLRIDSIEAIKDKFPQIYKKLRLSGVHSAAFYPIEGMDTEGNIAPIGMIVVMYNKQKNYYLGYYNECISPSIQILSTLLNYNTTAKNK
jgi:hypothetical protein|nr:MAG TPA: hypothetical protein [Caudoviricetes sp.]